MKRLLRYILYREVYRQLRKATRNSRSDNDQDSRPVEPDKAIEERGPDAFSSSGNSDDRLPEGTIDSPAELKAVLQRMDAYDFEHFVADLWERMGWETEVSAEAADKGVDVVATKYSPYKQTTLIQAKRYGPNTTVGSPEVQQYASLKNQYSDVDKVVIVTTNEFTGQGRELADRLNVKLVNGDDLVELIAETEAVDLVAQYLDFVSTVTDESEAGSDSTSPSTTEEQSRTSPSAETSSKQAEPREAPSSRWHKVTIAATLGWVVVFFDASIELLPDALWGLLFLGTWIALPIAIYKDTQVIDDQIDWPAYRWAYLIGALVWLFAVVPGIIYLIQRYRVVPSTQGESEGDETPHSGHETVGTSTEETIQDPQPATETTQQTDSVSGSDTTTSTQKRTVGYQDKRYTCEIVSSPDRTWTVAYGQGSTLDESRVFVYDSSELQFTEIVDEPITAAVADTGHTIVAEDLDPDDQAGKVTIFSPKGEEILTHYFNSNIADCVISGNGTYAATVTFSPDSTTYVFDIETGSVTATRENEESGKYTLEFKRESEGWRVYLTHSQDEKASYALDVDGSVVWKEKDFGEENTIDSLLESSDPENLRTAIDQLQDEYESIDQERERNDVANQLADAHWKLAQNLPDKETSNVLSHLERAKELYFELLPWYAGKEGVAKTLRHQADYYQKQGNEEEAFDCYQQIKHLEEEYNVQLLTEEDENRLEALSGYSEAD